jgi:HK97 family phage portal protein
MAFWKNVRDLFTVTPMPARAQEVRAITEFAIIDGQQIFGNGGGVNTYRGGMTIPGAWRAALLISGLLGQVPWHAYRERAGNPIERITPTPPLLDQPAPPDTRMTTFSSWGLDLIWDGNAVGIIAARNSENWPTAVLPVPARMVGIRRVGRESLSQLPIGAIEYKIGNLTFGTDEIIHIKGPCEPGAVRGLGVLEAHINGSLELAAEQIRQAKNIAASGVPTGKLTTTDPDATPAEMKAAKTEWMTAQRERTVAALSPSTDFEPIAWNPEEMQMVEARRYSLTELELIFGLPVGWLGGMNSARQYSNIEQDAVNLLKFTLGDHLGRFEQTLSLKYPHGTKVRANLDAVLRSDTLTRYKAHAIALKSKFKTVDEVREIEELPPMPEDEEPPPPPVLFPVPDEPEEEIEDVG